MNQQRGMTVPEQDVDIVDRFIKSSVDLVQASMSYMNAVTSNQLEAVSFLRLEQASREWCTFKDHVVVDWELKGSGTLLRDLVTDEADRKQLPRRRIPSYEFQVFISTLSSLTTDLRTALERHVQELIQEHKKRTEKDGDISLSSRLESLQHEQNSTVSSTRHQWKLHKAIEMWELTTEAQQHKKKHELSPPALAPCIIPIMGYNTGGNANSDHSIQHNGDITMIVQEQGSTEGATAPSTGANYGKNTKTGNQILNYGPLTIKYHRRA